MNSQDQKKKIEEVISQFIEAIFTGKSTTITVDASFEDEKDDRQLCFNFPQAS